VIIILYVNDEATLRKQGASTDRYEVFKRLISQGKIRPDFGENWKAIRQELARGT
jgi:hypothetical protein